MLRGESFIGEIDMLGWGGRLAGRLRWCIMRKSGVWDL